MKKSICTLFFLLIIGMCYSQKEFRSKSNDPKILIGCWFIPHAATLKIHFKKDRTFIFNDVDDTTLKGRYNISNGIITLVYNDRKSQNFYLKYFINDKSPYYTIYKKGYSFVKNIENDGCKG